MVTVMWSSGAALLLQGLAVHDGIMNSALNKEILKEDVQPSICPLKLKHIYAPWNTNGQWSGLKKPGLKSYSDALVWPWTQTSWSKTLQCGWINNSVKEEWDKIHVKDSLPVMINEWLQLLCKEWHNQLCSLNHSYVNLWDFAQEHPSNYWNTPAYLASTNMSHSQSLKWPFWCPFVYAETHTVLTADILDL